MAYTIDQFGFTECKQIPVKPNDWAKLLETFMASDANVICRNAESEGKNASNMAGAIRKAAESMGLDIEVVTIDGSVYIQKA